MAKHLLPLKHLKELLLAICLSIIAVQPVAAAQPSTPEDNKPSLDSIHIKPYKTFSGFRLTLDHLIPYGFVTGIPRSEWRSYVPSCDDPNVVCTDTTFQATRGSFTVTFTHTEYPDVKFDVPVTALLPPGNLLSNVTLYKGQTKEIQLPENYLTEDNEEIVLTAQNGEDPYNIIKLEIDTIKKVMTLECLKTGQVHISYYIRLAPNVVTGSGWYLNVYELPSAENIKVLEKNIVVPTGVSLYLSSLIENNVVMGANGGNADYSIESSTTDGVSINENYNSIYFSKPLTTTVTYTHKELPDVKFSIEVTAENSPANYVRNNLGTVYEGTSKTITIPDDYMPLSDFTVEKRTNSNYPDADFNFTIEGNQITIEGVTEGQVYLYFNHKFGTTTVTVNIAKKPSAENIKVLQPSIEVPIGTSVYLKSLVENGVVKGILNDYTNYSIETSDPSTAYNNRAGAFAFNKAGTAVITFTHKEFPEVSFLLNVTAHYDCPSNYVSQKLGTVYVGITKSITIPDNYLPLSDYTFSTYNNYNTPEAKFDYQVNGNEITFTGVTEGVVYLTFQHKIGGTRDVPVNITSRPTGNNITVIEKNIIIPTNTSLYLSSLISNNVVEGVSGTNIDYEIESSVTNNVQVNNNYGYVNITSPLTTTVTYTNKEFPDVKFSIEVTAENNPANYVRNNLGTVYEGTSKTITIPDEYLPLSDFTLSKRTNSNYPDADFNFTIEGNQITVEGVHEGQAYLYFTHKYGNSTVTVNIAKKPAAENIKMNEKSITVPTSTSIYLSSLIQNGVVEGIGLSGSDKAYEIASSVTNNVYVNNNNGYININSPLTTTVTYTNKEFPDVKFSIEVTAENNPANYVRNNLGTVYEGTSKTITIPDEYLPLSDFTLSKRTNSNYPDADFNFTIEGNQITVEGVHEGQAYLYFTHKYGTSTATINIAKKPSAENIKVKKQNIMTNNGLAVRLNNLIQSGVIEGISQSDWQSYVPSCADSNVECTNTYFRAKTSGTYTITYTHTEIPDIKFDIIVTTRLYTGNLFSDLSLYKGQPKVIEITDEYLPLSEYESIELISDSDEDPNSIVKLDVDKANNRITLEGLKLGTVTLHFTIPYGGGYQNPIINVLEMPSLDNFQVLKPSAEMPIGNFVYLSDLVEKGYVEGIPSDYTNYTIESSDRNIAYSDKAGRFFTTNAGTVIVTFTHKDFPEITFPIEVTARYECPSGYIQSNLRTLYIGTSQTFTIPDDYLPLSDFDLSIYDSTNSPDAKFEYVVNGNEITLTGLRTGSACLQFDYKEIGVVQVLINVVPKPSANNVKVLKPAIVIPTGLSIYPVYALLNGGVVEGLSGTNADYSVESSNNSIVTCNSTSGYFRFINPGTATITFTNKSVPEETFSIDVTAKKSLEQFSQSEIAYVGETKTIIVPDRFISPGDYTFEIIADPDSPDADCGVVINGNEIALTGISAGKKTIKFEYRIGHTATWFSMSLNIVKRSIPVKVNKDGEATAGAQLGVPVTVELPEDVDLSTNEGESIVWESENKGIASVNPETGEITPNALGVTNITVKKVSESSSLSRASSNAETLVTIEFWVTKLEMAGTLNLQPNTSKQLTYSVNAGKEKYPYKVTTEWNSSDPDVASVNADGVVTAHGEGSAVITLTTDIGTCEVIVTVEVSGKDVFDINSDGHVNVSDVVSLVDLIIHQTADKAVHDLNGDGEVNVSDIVLLVNRILHGEAAQSAAMRSRGAHEVPMLFDMSRACTAMQTDIVVAEGARIEDVMINSAIARSHSLSYREIEPGRYRVIVFSAGNQPMQLDEDEPLFTLALTGDSRVETEATIFVDAELAPTAIDSVSEDAEVESVTYFDLQGRKVSAETKGIVIERTVFTNGRVSTRKIKK